MKKKRRFKAFFIILFILMIILIGACIFVGPLYDKERSIKILSNIEGNIANVNKYYVYGTHFNIEGELSGVMIPNIKDIKVSLIDILENEKEYDVLYEITDKGIKFSISNLINTGLYLDDIETGKYFLLLKITDKNGDVKYYSMKNNTDYKDIEYYTITRNKSNKRVNIDFDILSIEEANIPYIKFTVAKVKLPGSVYDISIDPGHGGSDPGAMYGNYKESEIAMKHSAELKQSLEKLGLKVILTRDGTEDTSKESKFNVYSVYNFEGRVNVVGRSKAKYNFSIHINSYDTNTLSGTEIYAPSNASLNFAQSIADNIVNIANTTYSTRKTDKVSDGVYVKTFLDADIQNSKQEAIKKGFEPYDIKPGTPYFYMIREVGGIVTGAYIDGRNKLYGTNMYYNSNIGVESYLIELGYIINSTDLSNMLNNQSSYVKAITKSIEEGIYKE